MTTSTSDLGNSTFNGLETAMSLKMIFFVTQVIICRLLQHTIKIEQCLPIKQTFYHLTSPFLLVVPRPDKVIVSSPKNPTK